LLQAFPKKSLAVLWDFKGLQGFQTSFDAFQIFLLWPPLFSRILDAAGAHSAASLGARPGPDGGTPVTISVLHRAISKYWAPFLATANCSLAAVEFHELQ
jgi:hypothetical protein